MDRSLLQSRTCGWPTASAVMIELELQLLLKFSNSIRASSDWSSGPPRPRLNIPSNFEIIKRTCSNPRNSRNNDKSKNHPLKPIESNLWTSNSSIYLQRTYTTRIDTKFCVQVLNNYTELFPVSEFRLDLDNTKNKPPNQIQRTSKIFKKQLSLLYAKMLPDHPKPDPDICPSPKSSYEPIGTVKSRFRCRLIKMLTEVKLGLLSQP